MALLAGAPQPDQPGRTPSAMFSLLKPNTRIPAHVGVSNARLVTHLPLIVPEGCGFRVGNETRQWVPGKAWVFDDTIEHEAWNDSDQLRVVLIFDIWHPDLSPAERAMITALTAASTTSARRPASTLLAAHTGRPSAAWHLFRHQHVLRVLARIPDRRGSRLAGCGVCIRQTKKNGGPRARRFYLLAAPIRSGRSCSGRSCGPARRTPMGTYYRYPQPVPELLARSAEDPCRTGC